MSKEIQVLDGEKITSDGKMNNQDVLKRQMSANKAEFLRVLPAHITFEKFQRVVMTAVIQNPELLSANRQTLLFSAIKAATDGLLPDGREAAFVIFNSKDGKDEHGKDRWMKRIQYIPMWSGLLKKIRQSGELSSVVAHVVYQKDKFEYVLGDEEKIIHEPYMGTDPRGSIIAAYAIARLKDGTIVREVMTIQDIEKIRMISKSGNDKDGNPTGIWKQWYEEMARKTVFRRLSKWLPQSAELMDRVFENDETMDVVDGVVPDESTIGYKPLTITETKQALLENQPDLKMEIIKEKDAEALSLENEVLEKQKSLIVDNDEQAEKRPPTKLEKDKARVLQAINLSDTKESLSELWDKDFKPELDFINKQSPNDYAELVQILQDKMASLQNGKLI